MTKTLLIASLAAAGLWCGGVAQAQVAGSSTTLGVSVTESIQVAQGWSVKKTIMGKTIYTDAGEKIGKVEDLIISPERNVSYVIVGAGGFIGMGRHDVAIPVAQIKNQSGRLVMPGATKDVVKSLPAFDYVKNTAGRDEFVATVDRDIATAKTRLEELRKTAAAASKDTKAKLETQINVVEVDMKSAESKLAEMKGAAAKRWKEFEAGVTAANDRLRKSIDKALA